MNILQTLKEKCYSSFGNATMLKSLHDNGYNIASVDDLKTLPHDEKMRAMLILSDNRAELEAQLPTYLINCWHDNGYKFVPPS